MAVRRVGDSLGLDGGVDCDPLQLAMADSFRFDRDRDGFGQKRLQITRPNSTPPACHGRPIERQGVLEMRLATERLKVWVLQPSRAGLLIAQPFHVLEQMHARHQPRRQTSPPLGSRDRAAQTRHRTGSSRSVRPAAKAHVPDQIIASRVLRKRSPVGVSGFCGRITNLDGQSQQCDRTTSPLARESLACTGVRNRKTLAQSLTKPCKTHYLKSPIMDDPPMA